MDDNILGRYHFDTWRVHRALAGDAVSSKDENEGHGRMTSQERSFGVKAVSYENILLQLGVTEIKETGLDVQSLAIFFNLYHLSPATADLRLMQEVLGKVINSVSCERSLYTCSGQVLICRHLIR